MKEQRQHQRGELITEAMIADSAGTDWSAVSLLDISISGASFKTTERIIVDTIRMFNITLHNSPKPVLASAKIVNRLSHADGFRVGIRFVKIDPHEVELINQYVQSQAAMP